LRKISILTFGVYDNKLIKTYPEINAWAMKSVQKNTVVGHTYRPNYDLKKMCIGEKTEHMHHGYNRDKVESAW